MPDVVVELIARRLRVVGQPARIRLLERLREGEATVDQLAGATPSSQQNVSKHLGVLLTAGIVGRRKEGTCVYYRITDASVFDLYEQVCGSLERQYAEIGEVFEGAFT